MTNPFRRDLVASLLMSGGAWNNLVALRRLILKATIRRITWLRSECRDGRAA